MSESSPPVNQGFIRWGLPCLVLGLVIGAFAGAYVVPILTGGNVKANPSAGGKVSTPRDERPREREPAPKQDDPGQANPEEDSQATDGQPNADGPGDPESGAPPGR
ncbi:MAG: hypothetical protein H6811_03615 [Phycisphaeraceae bacterium]|nr:hypothetical protein [Phycisphaeraceae bacterium]